ncbi:MAG: hypothetical protein CMM56_07635 [Rhodospirillaceae bacterium]|nr:hypothetical protein [Rhodospirillaceae bacterium]|tara:strand:+ start:8232 stop:9350 length:1119 start_codon:yes stop_codon:yes gene_type:complete
MNKRMIKANFYLAITSMGIALSGNTQNASSKFVVSGSAAKAMLDTTSINLETAEKITMACERLAEEEEVSISVYVIDNDGNNVYMHRMDGERWVNTATAEMKAQTALTIRGPSKERMNQVIRNPSEEWQQIELGVFSNSGGLPIIVDDQLIGAIGVGGSAPRVEEGWSDEICAHKAMTEVMGPQPPLAEDIPRPRTPTVAPVPRFSVETPTSNLPPEFVVSGDAAAEIRNGAQISGDAARNVAQACRAWSTEREDTMSLVILDPSGVAVHGERMDGQVNTGIQAAMLRAQTALQSRDPTSVRGAGLANRPYGLPRSVLLFEWHLEPGGLPIVVDGQMIGAIGVGGSKNDEACAIAGLQSVFGDRVAVPVYPN